jgi:hypothetical protein
MSFLPLLVDLEKWIVESGSAIFKPYSNNEQWDILVVHCDTTDSEVLLRCGKRSPTVLREWVSIDEMKSSANLIQPRIGLSSEMFVQRSIH